MVYTAPNRNDIAAQLPVQASTHLLVADNLDDHQARILTTEGDNTAQGQAIAALGTRATNLEGRATSLEGRATALENNASGSGYHSRQASATTPLSGTAAVVKYGTELVTGSGVSYNTSTGAFTFSKAGKWKLSATVDLAGVQTTSDTSVLSQTWVSAFFAKAVSGAPSGTKYGNATAVANSGFGGSVAIGWEVMIAANDVYYVWSLVSRSCTSSATEKTAFVATYMGPP